MKGCVNDPKGPKVLAEESSLSEQPNTAISVLSSLRQRKFEPNHDFKSFKQFSKCSSESAQLGFKGKQIWISAKQWKKILYFLKYISTVYVEKG